MYDPDFEINLLIKKSNSDSIPLRELDWVYDQSPVWKDAKGRMYGYTNNLFCNYCYDFYHWTRRMYGC